ncbi:MAG TPA: SCO family protein [Stellaceae bacterium]|nr:SCO family protein [Stellaceae bacterium]
MAVPPEIPKGASRFGVMAMVLAGLLVIAAGALLTLAVRNNPNGAAGSLFASAIGGPFHLVDQNGNPFSDADLKGKWHLIFFGYSNCQDTCPTVLNEMALALDRLGKARDGVGIVFITTDPERDTPSVLKSYVANFDAPIIALTGSAEAVQAAEKAYRVYSAKHPLPDGGYDMDHSAAIYLMDPQGRAAATLSPDAPAQAIANRLEKLLS